MSMHRQSPAPSRRRPRTALRARTHPFAARPGSGRWSAHNSRRGSMSRCCSKQQPPLRQLPCRRHGNSWRRTPLLRLHGRRQRLRPCHGSLKEACPPPIGSAGRSMLCRSSGRGCCLPQVLHQRVPRRERIRPEGMWMRLRRLLRQPRRRPPSLRKARFWRGRCRVRGAPARGTLVRPLQALSPTRGRPCR